ncbi:MAG: helix-turn-helix domain-containing protein [Xanthobacteraceae bacterium]
MTKSLLAEGESERSDFKRAPDGVSADDLVSFANTDVGGSILVGIEERTGPDGAQIGSVRGCDVSDATILQITNKALSCFPPVAIQVFIENLGEVPFLRVDVPSSQTKPHCTPKGVYCRRDGSRNRPLHPGELLKIFLESESRAFAEKFEAAASRIANDLSQLEASLDRSIKSMADQLGWAEYKLDDTEGTLSSILAHAQRLSDESNDISTRLRALFRQDKRDDPVRAKAREELLEEIVKQLLKDPDLHKKIAAGGSVSMTAQGKAAVELDKDELQSVLLEAIKRAGS